MQLSLASGAAAELSLRLYTLGARSCQTDLILNGSIASPSIVSCSPLPDVIATYPPVSSTSPTSVRASYAWAAGVVIGAILIAIVLVFLVLWIIKRKKRHSSASSSSTYLEAAPETRSSGTGSTKGGSLFQPDEAKYEDFL